MRRALGSVRQAPRPRTRTARPAFRSAAFRASGCLIGLILAAGGLRASAEPIDRRALVARHNPRVTAVDPRAPLTVGNGHFAFTVDATGLQTFGVTCHAQGIPLETLARWAWHSEPNPEGFRLEDAQVPYRAHDRTV